MDKIVETSQRKLTPIERIFSWSPFSIVTLVARIRGDVTEEMLTQAVSKARKRHFALQARIKVDEHGDPWFTTEDVGEIPIDVVHRESADDWVELAQQKGQIPCDFERQPAIRFLLVQSPEISELVILCHHIICDGLSLAYLARDILQYMGDPNGEVVLLPTPAPITRENTPGGASLNKIVQFFIRRMNKQWEADQIRFDQQDYESLSRAYWGNYQHTMIPVELNEEETSKLVKRCKAEQVTVNSALAAAFIGAQVLVIGEESCFSKVAVAANLRERLTPPVGEGMGFYAGLASPKFKYDPKQPFWDNARRFHVLIQPYYTDKHLFNDFTAWWYLDPAILEAINFKKLGGLVSPDSVCYEKLSTFAQREDVVLSILKRDQMESLEKRYLGTAVTNLTRLNFPKEYGMLKLERLILKPGGAFPLVSVNLVVGAVTCADKLSLVMEFARQAMDTTTAERVKKEAQKLLQIPE